ncbi:hypothetical protein J7E62_31415 [Variovorax paradoxus]|nr:hypothetical protein [Variovorax paradoxus]
MIAKRVTPANQLGLSLNLSTTTMEEALHDVPLYREFAGLGDGVSRDPEMHQAKKGNQ